MAQKMTWKEIRKAYPNEWVAVARYENQGAVAVSGEVIAHDDDKKSFYAHSSTLLPSYGKLAIRFTGELVKNADTPLLWQISATK